MTPQELASTAVSCAKADFLHYLSRMKFYGDEVPRKAYPAYVETFIELAFNQLTALIAQERKRHNGLANRKITVLEDTYHIIQKGSRFLLTMNNISSSVLNWIPEDLDYILHEFSGILADRSIIANEVVSEYWASLKAGEIAQTTVNTGLRDLLEKEQFDIEIFCRHDSWYCQLYSKDRLTTLSFLSGAERIFEDIERVLGNDR